QRISQDKQGAGRRVACRKQPGTEQRPPLHRAQARALDLGAGATEPTLALLEERQRLEILALAEIRPQRVGDDDLGVRQLPEEEVADALLAAGADEEIGIWHALGGQALRDGVLGDLLRRQLAALHAPRDG